MLTIRGWAELSGLLDGALKLRAAMICKKYKPESAVVVVETLAGKAGAAMPLRERYNVQQATA